MVRGWLRQEGTPGDHRVQASGQIRVRQSRLLTAVTSKVFNISKDGDHSLSGQPVLVLNHPHCKKKKGVFLKEWFLCDGLTLADCQLPPSATLSLHLLQQDRGTKQNEKACVFRKRLINYFQEQTRLRKTNFTYCQLR